MLCADSGVMGVAIADPVLQTVCLGVLFTFAVTVMPRFPSAVRCQCQPSLIVLKNGSVVNDWPASLQQSEANGGV